MTVAFSGPTFLEFKSSCHSVSSYTEGLKGSSIQWKRWRFYTYTPGFTTVSFYTYFHRCFSYCHHCHHLSITDASLPLFQPSALQQCLNGLCASLRHTLVTGRSGCGTGTALKHCIQQGPYNWMSSVQEHVHKSNL